MKYIYETHLHTAQGSACARTLGRDYPKIYKALGYDGIFVTDHFFQGNCAAPRTGRWVDRVDSYMSGYFEALNEGIRIGFDVFFGIEQNYHGDEYLIYGIDRDFLIQNPEIERWPREKLFNEVRAYGGCAVQAHPFRERGYISKMHFQVKGIDAVEGVNMGNKPHEDASALIYAKNLGLPVTSGSDIHDVERATPDRLSAVALNEKLTSSKHYAEYLRAQKPISLIYPSDRLAKACPRLPETPYELSLNDYDLKQLIELTEE